MSRTYRRRGQYHEYHWVPYDWSDATPWWAHALLDPRSKEGRRAIARFHSDAEITMRSGVPHWFCRIFKRRQRNANIRELLRWTADPGYDPVIQVRHRNSAKWAWW